jgi:hypothetical protein
MVMAQTRGTLELVGITSQDLDKEHDMIISKGMIVSGRVAPWRFELAVVLYPMLYEPYREYYEDIPSPPLPGPTPPPLA